MRYMFNIYIMYSTYGKYMNTFASVMCVMRITCLMRLYLIYIYIF